METSIKVKILKRIKTRSAEMDWSWRYNSTGDVDPNRTFKFKKGNVRRQWLFCPIKCKFMISDDKRNRVHTNWMVPLSLSATEKSLSHHKNESIKFSSLSPTAFQTPKRDKFEILGPYKKLTRKSKKKGPPKKNKRKKKERKKCS